MAETSPIAAHTRQEVRNHALVCLFLVGFGAAWFCSGLAGVGHASLAALAGVGIVSMGLLAMSALLFRRGSESPADPPESDRDRRLQLMFRAVNIIQWVSIATAVTILAILRMPEYIVPAIATIVGLHLFPLGDTFRLRQYYVTGTLLIVWALGSLAMLPRDRVSGIAALGAGIILLASSAWTLTTYRTAGAAVRSAGVQA